jgi:hypothetical protein
MLITIFGTLLSEKRCVFVAKPNVEMLMQLSQGHAVDLSLLLLLLLLQMPHVRSSSYLRATT